MVPIAAVNRLPPNLWLKTPQMYFLIELKVRSLKWVSNVELHSFLEALGENSSPAPPIPAFRGCPHSLGDGRPSSESAMTIEFLSHHIILDLLRTLVITLGPYE